MLYTIKQNKHYSTFQFPSIFIRWKNRILRRDAVFSHECMYESSGNDGQINKLYGFSLGVPHQANYLLFGWRARKDRGGIELLPYRHANWKWIADTEDPEPFLVKTGEKVTLQISTKVPDVFIFSAKTDSKMRMWTIAQDKLAWWNIFRYIPIAYTLKPYFGGRNPAPHDMTIELS